MEDYEQSTVIGAVFGIVITSLIFYLVLCSMCESEEFSLFGERFVRVDAEQEDVESSWERSRASFDCMEDCLFCSTEEFDRAYDGCEEFCSVWVYKLENSYTWRRC